MSYLILHLPLPDRYRGAWAAAQMKLGCKPHDADLDPGVMLALLPPGVDVDTLRAGLPSTISCTLGDVEQQASAAGAAVVIHVTGSVLEVWNDLMDNGATSLDNTPTITLATGMYDDLESVQDMLTGQRVYFDTLDVLDLETGDCVASFDLDETEDTDDDD